MSGEGKFTTTEDDLVAGNQLHARQLWNRRAVLRGWVLFTIAVLLAVFGFCGRVGWALLWAPAAASAYMVVGYYFSQAMFSRYARKGFRQALSFWRPTAIQWDDDSVQFTSDRGQSRDVWTSYYSWAADDRSILLYQSANLFITLPVRDVGNDARISISAALKKAGVKQRSSL